MTQMPPELSPRQISGLLQHWQQQTQQWWRGASTSMSWGLSPIATQLAATDWCLHWLSSPEAAQRWMNAWPAPQTELKDGRFDHPAWQQWPFQALKTHHAQWTEHVQSQVCLEGMLPHHQQLMGFLARQWTEMASPANWPWSNPEVAIKGAETLGMSHLKGLQLWAQDQLDHHRPHQPLSHEVGRDVAVTPGKVVMRNHLVELIQYAPSTPTVASEPLLIVPSCIMKYYILDLSPHNSMVRYLRDQGFTVFVLSWRNPDEHDRDLGLDDYLRLGLIDSMAAIRRLTGCDRLHSLGYCLGGTFLAMVASLLARASGHISHELSLENLPTLASITLLAAQTDFSEPGDLGVFIDPDQVRHLRADMQRQGYLSGRQMAAAFQLLNARDLIWGRQTRRYLLGEEDHSMDLMSWNADATRLPARMHSEYLHELFLRNALASGHGRALGQRIAQVVFQRYGIADLRTHGRVEHHIARAARAFGFIHGDVSVAQHAISIRLGMGTGHDTDTHRRNHPVPLHGVGHSQSVQQTARDMDCIEIAPDVIQQHHELVSADTGRHFFEVVAQGKGITRPEAVFEAARDLAQQTVAHRMPQGVVDLLEAVKVHEQDGKVVARLGAVPLNRRADQLQHHGPVGQGRQVVSARCRAELLLQGLLGIDVHRHAGNPQHPALHRAVRRAACKQNPDPATGLMPQAHREPVLMGFIQQVLANRLLPGQPIVRVNQCSPTRCVGGQNPVGIAEELLHAAVPAHAVVHQVPMPNPQASPGYGQRQNLLLGAHFTQIGRHQHPTGVTACRVCNRLHVHQHPAPQALPRQDTDLTLDATALGQGFGEL